MRKLKGAYPLERKIEVGQTLSLNPGSVNGLGDQATVAPYGSTTKKMEFRILNKQELTINQSINLFIY